MTDCQCRPIVTSLAEPNVEGTTSHQLSFGLVKFVVRSAKSKPKRLRRQMFHKDGPTMFDPLQFDNIGNILPNAPAQSNRTSPLPPCDARSGLFAFFTRTFLGLPPTNCSDPTRGLRLYASPGRAIIFYMDREHQGWMTSDFDHADQVQQQCDELSVHVRSHFYMYSSDMRFLPTSDLEERYVVCVWRLPR